MANHMRLLVTPHTEMEIGKMVQSVGRRYVQYFNYTHQRTGTLWEGRYRATIIDAERYLPICYRYIELNPVRAAMVKHPREYAWFSYRCHAEGRHDPLVTDHPIFRALGRDDAIRRAAYRALFKVQIDEEILSEG